MAPPLAASQAGGHTTAMGAGPHTGHRAAQPAAALRVERLDTVEAILAAAHDLGRAATPTGFQSPAWLASVYRHLVPACAGTPLGLALRCPATGVIAALLPLYVRTQGRLRVARFADCGVSDYNLPLSRDLPPPDPANAAALIIAIKPWLSGVDILALDRLPLSPANLLSCHPQAVPCRLSGHTLTIPGTADDYVRSRGKKFRKEVERSFRVLASEGAWAFERAQTPAGITSAFAALDRQQAERHAGKGDAYELSAPHFAAFYRDVLRADPTLGQIFTLSVNGVIIAALFGIAHNGTFTLLRIANGGEPWRHVSPGRLIVIEVMCHFAAHGIKTFDMGLGDYAFKRGFGTQPTALADLMIPLSWRGLPHVAAARLKARLRQNKHAAALVRSLRAKISN